MAFARFLSKKDNQAEHDERREILEAMQKTREELAQARANFNDAREPELVESCVYEMNALQARYAYYVRLTKELQYEEKIGFRVSRLPD